MTTLYGPVALHMCECSFQYNNKPIKMNFLLMSDYHTEQKDIKETKTTYKLQNFILNIPKTNKRCFDLFVEAYSPHIKSILKYKELNPENYQDLHQASHILKNVLKIVHKYNILSVGTGKSNVYDYTNYKIPLISLRKSPLLLDCRYHDIKIYGKRKNCKFLI